MEQKIKASDIKEQVALADLLAGLGYRPVKKSGKEHFYLSMLRDTDVNPSFTVNNDLNVWYDHGMGKGGNIIDFALAYWPGVDFPEVMLNILRSASQDIIATNNDKPARRRHAVKLPHYKVEEVKELGNSPAITAYLQSRNIWTEAQGRLKEVYYFVEDEKKLRKNYFAAGWQNEFGAWEVRNKYFKGCIGHKGVSFIPGSNESVAIFEGYLNYLSWLSENPGNNTSILVTNTLSLIAVAVKKAVDFPVVDLYFDRDKSGHNASQEFIKAVPHAIDRSDCYAGYGDYNDKKMANVVRLDLYKGPSGCNDFSGSYLSVG